MCENAPQLKIKRPILEWGGTPFTCTSMQMLFETLQDFYSDGNGDEEITITFVEMTDAELQALPEFQGF